MTTIASDMLNNMLTTVENITIENNDINIKDERWYTTFIEGLYASNKGRIAGYYEYLNHTCYRLLTMNKRTNKVSRYVNYSYIHYTVAKLIYATFYGKDYNEISSKRYRIEFVDSNAEYLFAPDNLKLIDTHESISYQYKAHCNKGTKKASNKEATNFDSPEFREAVFKVLKEMFNH